MSFYLSIFWKDTKKDKNKYFSLLTVSDLNDGYKATHRKQLCQVSHCKGQTDNTWVFLLRLLKETAEQSWERLPSSAQGNCRRHGRSLTATASCGRGVKSMETQMVVSSTAGVLAKAHTSSYLWFSHNHICMPFFLDKNIYSYKKLIIQL